MYDSPRFRQNRRLRWAVGISMMTLVAACQADVVEPRSTSCVEPPAEALEASVDFSLDPEPVDVPSGGVVALSYELAERTGEEVMSISAAWQCWTGDDWVTTHQVFHRSEDPDGDGRIGSAGAPLQLPQAGATTTEAGIGLPVPLVSEVRIPSVAPGKYRIVDSVLVGADRELVGIVIVTVTGSPS